MTLPFEEFKEEETRIYVLFIGFLMVARVTSYLESSILNVVN